MKQLFREKATPRNRDEDEIMDYRDVLNTIHESNAYIPVRPTYILQLHRDLLMGFNMLREGCKYLKDHDIKYIFNIVVSENNFHNLDNYVMVAVDFGASEVKIGTIGKIGNAINLDDQTIGYNLEFEKNYIEKCVN